MDSLALFFTLSDPIILQISQIYSFASESSLQVQTMSVQQQEGSKECGLFSIAMALEVCSGNNPESVSFRQDAMRAHLIDCFVNGRLSVFPKKSPECIPRPPRHQYTIDLFCYCQMPEIFDEMMISCDLCRQWFHCSCACIAPGNIPDVWKCKPCQFRDQK